MHHPALELDFIFSTTRAGKPVTAAHPDLLGSLDITFTETVNADVDLLYLCLGHGNSRAFLEQHSFSKKTIIIDLGNDFRLTMIVSLEEDNLSMVYQNYKKKR